MRRLLLLALLSCRTEAPPVEPTPGIGGSMQNTLADMTMAIGNAEPSVCGKGLPCSFSTLRVDGAATASSLTVNGTAHFDGGFTTAGAIASGASIMGATADGGVGLWLGVAPGAQTATNYTLYQTTGLAVRAPASQAVSIQSGSDTNYVFNADSTITPKQVNSTPTQAEGKLFYVGGVDHAWSYLSDVTGYVVNMGKTELVDVFNDTGATFPTGTIIYFNGRDATTNLFTIGLADADSALTAHADGVMSHSCGPNSRCAVTVIGRVKGFDTSAFATGAIVYLSTSAGAMTATKPAAPAFVTPLGEIGLSDATVGWMQARVGRPTDESELLGNFSVNAVNNIQTYGGMKLLNAFTVSQVCIYVSTPVAGAGTSNVPRVTDGSNNCDATFSCATLGTAGLKCAAPTGTCAFAANANLTFSETAAGCTPDPAIKNAVWRGYKP